MKNFSTFFWSAFQTNKDAIAFHGEESITFWTWTRSVQKLAVGLLDVGFERGERLAIISNDRRLFFDFAFAAWLAGGCIVPVPSGRDRSETLRRLARAGCDWIVVDSEQQRRDLVGTDGKVPDTLHWIVTEADGVTDALTHASLLEKGRFRSKRGGIDQLAKRTFETDGSDTALLLMPFEGDIATAAFSGDKLHRMLTYLHTSLDWNEQSVALQLSLGWFYAPLLGIYALTHGNALIEGRTSHDVADRISYATTVVCGAAYLSSITETWIETHRDQKAPEVPKTLRDLVAVVGASALTAKIRKEFRKEFGDKLDTILLVDATVDPDLDPILTALGVAALPAWGRPEFGISHVTTDGAKRAGSIGRPVYGYACKTVGTKTGDDTPGPIAIRTDVGLDEYWNGDGDVTEAQGWLVTPIDGRLESGFLFLESPKS